MKNTVKILSRYITRFALEHGEGNRKSGYQSPPSFFFFIFHRLLIKIKNVWQFGFFLQTGNRAFLFEKVKIHMYINIFRFVLILYKKNFC